MPKLKYLFIVFAFVSCEKVIKLDLNEEQPQIVIEANLYLGNNPFEVKISETTSYYENEQPKPISNAEVVITDENGNSTILAESTTGLYNIENFEALENKAYTLNVSLENGQTYEASAKMPFLVEIDTLIFEFEPESLFGKEGYVPYNVFQEPAGQTNFYQMVLTVNGDRDYDLGNPFIFDDSNTNGNLLAVPLFGERLQVEDTTTIELISMDEFTFDYLETLSAIVGGQDSAAPANPNNNWSNGALGHFAVYAASKKTVVVKE